MLLSYRECIIHPINDPHLCPSVGTSYEGVVSNVLDYGVFVRLSVGLEGLLHASILPEGFKSEVGKTIIVVVTTVDVENRRVALALPSAHPSIIVE